MKSRLPAAFLGPPIAHRGLHDRAAGVIENSLSAIEAATRAGYGVEIDLQLSADGEAMVFHDETLERMTNAAGQVRERTAAELRRLMLTGDAGEDDPIPTLAEALEAAGESAALLVDIKHQERGAGFGPLEARAAELLARHRGPIAVMSFHPASVFWFRDHAPEIPRGLVSFAFESLKARRRWPAAVRRSLARLEAFEASGADFVSYGHDDLPTPQIDALRAAGVPVLCWTVRSQAEETAARAHSDNITFEDYHPTLP
jgi:glycerophosphoryl diester phosphodiesterase